MTGSLRAKDVQNQRSRPTPLTRKKERIARRLGIVRRPRSAPTFRKKKNYDNEQDALVRIGGKTRLPQHFIESNGWYLCYYLPTALIHSQMFDVCAPIRPGKPQAHSPVPRVLLLESVHRIYITMTISGHNMTFGNAKMSTR